MFQIDIVYPEDEISEEVNDDHHFEQVPEEFDKSRTIVWLFCRFGFNGPFRQYFSLYRAVSQREGGRGEKG